MPDRYDNSQPGSRAAAPDDEFQPQTSDHDSQLQNNPSGNAATGDELANFLGDGFTPDIIDSHPGRTYVQYLVTETEGGDYRPALVSGVMSAQGIYIAGWSIVGDLTDAGTPFLAALRDGIDANAPIVAYINSRASERWVLPGGIRTRFGLFYQIISGTPVGVIYTRTIRAD